MSEPAKLTAPLYTITPVTSGNKSVGIDRITNLPTSLPIHINADLHDWRIVAQVEPGVYRLSLEGSPYRYTGVEDKKKVVVTVEAELDREWDIRYWSEYQAVTIVLNKTSPPLAWTVLTGVPDAEIWLEPLANPPHQSQLFSI